jgi:hypothetical protein
MPLLWNKCFLSNVLSSHLKYLEKLHVLSCLLHSTINWMYLQSNPRNSKHHQTCPYYQTTVFLYLSSCLLSQYTKCPFLSVVVDHFTWIILHKKLPKWKHHQIEHLLGNKCFVCNVLINVLFVMFFWVTLEISRNYMFCIVYYSQDHQLHL